MYTRPMRTTVEIRDDLRARLLAMAARRGEKGFSSIVEDALERYIQSEDERETARGRALMVRGALSAEAAAELEARTRQLREDWR